MNIFTFKHLLSVLGSSSNVSIAKSEKEISKIGEHTCAFFTEISKSNKK